ncbi:MAG TPA: hypothetical protein VHL52_13480 [Acidimicrobiia bacterium]|nr:hypothetical protein [Acidimicrobiia bacterium]
MRLEAAGVTVELPVGWEGEIGGGGGLAPQGVSRRPTVAHFANFPLPAVRADFGAEAVASMQAGDVFVVLFQYGAESAGKALFATEGVPRVQARDFDRNSLQHGQPGQSALQRFFTVKGRPFCLYVVVGSHIDRADMVEEVNRLLDSVTVS